MGHFPTGYQHDAAQFFIFVYLSETLVQWTLELQQLKMLFLNISGEKCTSNRYKLIPFFLYSNTEMNLF